MNRYYSQIQDYRAAIRTAVNESGVLNKTGGDAAKYFGALNIEMAEEIRMALKSHLSSRAKSSYYFETYGNCRYMFFLRYILGLNEDKYPQPSIGLLSMGSFYHQVLKAYAEATQTSDAADLPDKPKFETAFRNSCLFFQSKEIDGDLFRLEKERYKKTLWDFVRYESKALREIGSHIEDTEKVFKFISTVAEKRIVEFSGIIDRIDIADEGAAYRVYDYKKNDVKHYAEDSAIPLVVFQGYLYIRYLREQYPDAADNAMSMSYISVEKEDVKDKRYDLIAGKEFSSVWAHKEKEILYCLNHIERGDFSPVSLKDDFSDAPDIPEYYSKPQAPDEKPREASFEKEKKCAYCEYAQICLREPKRGMAKLYRAF